MAAFRSFVAVLLVAIAMSALAGEPSEHAATVPPITTASLDAFAALEEIFTAYSEGNTLRAEAIVDSTMIGRQQLIDAMRLSISQQKQIRVSLYDVQTVMGNDVVVIRTGWSKHYLTLPNMVPNIRKGQTIFLMQLTKEGWRVVGQSGDNIFAL